MIDSVFRLGLLFDDDLFGKPVPAFPDHALNQISHPRDRRAPGHRHARIVQPRILVKCFINYDRANDYDRHGQSGLERCIHAELTPATTR
jgi:hypothetical protein